MMEGKLVSFFTRLRQTFRFWTAGSTKKSDLDHTDLTWTPASVDQFLSEAEAPIHLVGLSLPLSNSRGRPNAVDLFLSLRVRARSSRQLAFNAWATGVLKDYLRHGYVVDPDKCRSNPGLVSNMERDIKLLQSQGALSQPVDD